MEIMDSTASRAALRYVGKFYPCAALRMSLLALAIALAGCVPQSRFEVLTRDAQGYALVYDRQSKKFLMVSPSGAVTEQTPAAQDKNPAGK